MIEILKRETVKFEKEKKYKKGCICRKWFWDIHDLAFQR